MTTTTKVVSSRPTNTLGLVAGVNKLGRIVSRVYGSGDPNYGVLGQIADNQFAADSYRTVSLSGDIGNTSLIPLVTGKTIEVKDYQLTASAVSIVRFMSSGNFLTGPLSVGANGLLSQTNMALRANISEPLVISNVAGTVGGYITYRLI